MFLLNYQKRFRVSKAEAGRNNFEVRVKAARVNSLRNDTMYCMQDLRFLQQRYCRFKSSEIRYIYFQNPCM
jgi:hypothetical protein